MRIFEKESVGEITNKYKNNLELKRAEKIYHQNIIGFRKSNIKYFMDSEEMNIYVKCSSDFFEFIKILDIKLFDWQYEWVNSYLENSHIILNKSRQMGATKIFGLLYLWEMLFKKKKIIHVTNKFVIAFEQLDKIKELYKSLPFYLKQGIISISGTSIEFENGSSFFVTTRESAVGCQYDILSIDEFAYIPKIQRVYSSLAMTCDKIIIVSSPRTYNDFFHKLCIGSKMPKNHPDSNFFHYIETPYYLDIRKDQKWIEEEKRMLNDEKSFLREYLCQFI